MAEKKRKSIDSGMKRLTQQCAAAILQTSKRRCPVGRTHKLKESGHLEKINDYTWKVAYSAKRAARGGKNVFYGYFVEFGGGWYASQHPKPFLLPALRIEAPKFQKKLKQLCSGWK